MFGPHVAGFNLRQIVLSGHCGYLCITGGTDTQAADGVMQDYHAKIIAEGCNNEFPLRDLVNRIDASGDFAGGRGTKWKFHHSRNVSPMATREKAAFAVSGKQGYTEGEITQRKIMARVGGSYEVFKDTMSRDAAAVDVQKDEMNRLIDDIAFREEFYCATDGRGIMALLSDDPGTGTDVDVDSPGNISGTDFGNRFFQEEMYVAAIDPATGTIRSGVAQVSSIGADGTDWTSAAAINSAWADNDYLVQAANGSVTSALDTSYEAAPWGLTAHIDDGTFRDNYHGVLRSVHAAAKSYVVSSTGALSTDLLQRVADVVYQKLGGKIDLLCCHPAIRRLIIQLTEADRRYSGASLMKPDPGTAAFSQGDITMGEVPIKAIRSLGVTQLFMLDSKGIGLKKYVSEEGKWVDDLDGSIWVRDGVGTNATDSKEAWYRRRYQYAVTAPGKAARLDAITGSTLVVVRAY